MNRICTLPKWVLSTRLAKSSTAKVLSVEAENQKEVEVKEEEYEVLTELTNEFAVAVKEALEKTSPGVY